MNQTKKRLAIIKLAISMTDTETIQLQVLKLDLLKTDSKMREILALLNAHNYAQAQRLISDYIDSPEQTTVIQRTSQEEVQQTPEQILQEAMVEKQEPEITKTSNDKPLTLKEKIQQAKDEAIIKQFELFTVTPEEENTPKIPLEEYTNALYVEPISKKISTKTTNYDTLLNVDAQDVLPDNITLDISANSNLKPIEQEFFNEELHTLPHTKEDDFFNQEKEYDTTDAKDVEIEDIQSSNQTEDIAPKKLDEIEALIQKEDIHYKAISYIDQKLKNMTNQYSPVCNSETEYPSVNTWLLQISNEGYLESEIEEIITQVEQLVTTDKAEAAQLLLIAAATESKYAQFRLARALYKGELLEKNLSEAFILIHRLAMNDNYPEAICDLAQFYENGIETPKDKEKAKELYKEAMNLGIKRASEHYNRLHSENHSLFSFFKK